LIPTTDRRALLTLLKLDKQINCIIPRGGEGLIRFVAETSTIPVIKHYKGVCSVYLDRNLDPAMAEAIVINAKCQRPSVCNAIENLFVHADIADSILPVIARSLVDRGVELRVDPAAAIILSKHEIEGTPVSDDDWSEEYVDLILAVGVVPSLEAAIDAINTYGSAHSDAIVTSDQAAAEVFLAGVDSATVYWNASTRFTDGFEFGLGAEIGISTDKLHARGPMGLNELCSYKYVIRGTGQIR
jgi:glutamate-5-semialdehyde dehydrogenase